MTQDHMVRGLALLAALISLSLGASQFGEVYRGIGKPFAGFLVFPNAVVAPTVLGSQPELIASLGLASLDRVVAIDGRPVSTGREVQAVAGEAGAGSELTYTLVRPDGEQFEAVIPVSDFPASFFFEFVLPLGLAGALMIAIGIVPILLRPAEPATRALFIWTWSLATNYNLLVPDYFWVYQLTPFLYPLGALAVASLFHLSLTFPERRWPMGTPAQGVALAGLYGVFLLLEALNIYSVLNPPGLTTVLDVLTMASLVGACVAFIGSSVYASFRGATVESRHRARIALSGPAVALATEAMIIAPFAFGWGKSLPIEAFLVPTFLIPLSLAYAILRRNIFELESVLRSFIALGFLVLFAGGVGLGAFDLTRSLVSQPVTWTAVLAAVAAMATVAPLLGSMRPALENLVRNLLFPAQRKAAQILVYTGRELVHLRSLEEISNLLARSTYEALGASSFSLIYAPSTEPLRTVGGRPLPAPLLASDTLRTFLADDQIADCDDKTDTRPEMEAMREHLAKHGLQVAVSLPVGADYRGGFLLGPRDDGRLNTHDDANLLQTLAAQVATATENARAWEEVDQLRLRLQEENVLLRREIERREGFEEIVGESPGIRAAMAQVEQVAPSDANVIVIGETGTGKELIVRALHRLSRRRGAPLLRVACAAIPEALVESELFGHERGAFTGADAAKPGRFELAAGGTLFLDDVDTLPLGVQAKLLRAIQEGEVQRLGSTQVRRVDLRVVSATNRDLLAAARHGKFREDLYYRLAVVPIQLPALAERREDIPLLVQSFIEHESEKLGREVRPVDPALLRQFQSYDWPGNIRELRNAVERAVVMSHGDVIRLGGSTFSSEVPGRGVSAAPAPGETATGGKVSGAQLDERSLAERVRDIKIELIRAALAESDGNQKRAAERLGLHRQSLNRMVRELGIGTRARESTGS